MQDAVIPCPHCHGTGEVRGSWWVVVRWQDGHDDFGPYLNREAAEQEALRRRKLYRNLMADVEFRRED